MDARGDARGDAVGAARGGDALAVVRGDAAAPRREKAASSINCKDFDSTKDDFGRWVSKFQKAVMITVNQTR